MFENYEYSEYLHFINLLKFLINENSITKNKLFKLTAYFI